MRTVRLARSRVSVLQGRYPVMIDKFLTKVFGSSNQRYLKGLQPTIERINELEAKVKPLSDDELRARIAEFREQIAQAVAEEDDKEARKRVEQEVLNEILPEVFAMVREASVRATGMRHFDVQLIGGIALHQGKIAEMRTGEGKTLVATLPATLNALTGRGVHVVSVNDYLATRDAEWMGRIYKFLGLTVGAIINDLDDWERKDSYGADITYGTNNEFGFDYLPPQPQKRLCPAPPPQKKSKAPPRPRAAAPLTRGGGEIFFFGGGGSRS